MLFSTSSNEIQQLCRNNSLGRFRRGVVETLAVEIPVPIVAETRATSAPLFNEPKARVHRALLCAETAPTARPRARSASAPRTHPYSRGTTPAPELVARSRQSLPA